MMNRQKYPARIRVSALILILVFMSGCVSATVIRSKPDGATVFMDNIPKGTTPFEYSDTAVAGTVKKIRLEKDGYKSLDTVISKDQFQAGPCIGGLLVLFPFLWVLGYPDEYEFALEPEKMQ